MEAFSAAASEKTVLWARWGSKILSADSVFFLVIFTVLIFCIELNPNSRIQAEMISPLGLLPRFQLLSLLNKNIAFSALRFVIEKMK